MKTTPEQNLAKVPEVTLGFWLIKIAAATLGESPSWSSSNGRPGPRIDE